MADVLELRERLPGGWAWRRITDHGEIVADSALYPTETEARADARHAYPSMLVVLVIGSEGANT